VRLLYHAATVKASGNVDSEGLIGRARDRLPTGEHLPRLPTGEHLPALPGRPGTPPRCPRRAAAASPQALLALLLRHSKIAAVVRGEWSRSPQPRVTQSHSIFNSNKQYILTNTNSNKHYIRINSHEEDRPRRSRANRPLSSGRTVSPITKECVVE